MQPSSREMQEAMNSLLNHQFDSTTSSHEDFLEHMLSSINNPTTSSWPPQWDPLSSQTPLASLQEQSALLADKLRQHQIAGGSGGGGGGGVGGAAAKALMLQQQLMLSRGIAAAAAAENCLRSPPGPGGSNSGLLPLPLSLAGNGDRNDVIVDGSSPFKSANNPGNDSSVQALYNGFLGQPSNQSQHFHQPQGGALQAQNFGAQAAPAMTQSTASGGSTATAGGGGTPAQPRQQRVRARRGQATDPHSIAERLRRERIAERMKALQELVPNANKTDKASMLDEIIDYVKFLQLQVKVLSMSRLGGAAAAAAAPLAADMASEVGGDCVSNGPQTASSSNNSDSMTVTEHQVAKLMEEDMGSAMQYLQGKGLCLMPISLATVISTATCQSRNPMNPGFNGNAVNNPLLALGVGAVGSNVNVVGEAAGPSSPSLSVLTVQSATVGNGGGGGSEPSSVKDATSVCKP